MWTQKHYNFDGKTFTYDSSESYNAYMTSGNATLSWDSMSTSQDKIIAVYVQ